MFYNISSVGYFGGVAKASRGPWFNEHFVEDDGMDWFYCFRNADGKLVYLLSNNLALKDRESLSNLYHSMLRNNRISWLAGLWLGFETVTRVGYFRSMALGWKMLSLFGLGYIYKGALMSWSSQMYGPAIGAYFRKYKNSVKTDLFEI